MSTFVYLSRSEHDTERLGRRLGELLPDGAVLALDGPLGAGKTRLVQGIAAGRGYDPRDVVSPTYTLVHEYRGPRPVFHFDVYRLRDEDEFLNLGPDEYFESSGVTVIEWAGKVAGCLPPDRLEIAIRAVDADTREFTIAARGEAYRTVVEKLSSIA